MKTLNKRLVHRAFQTLAEIIFLGALAACGGGGSDGGSGSSDGSNQTALPAPAPASGGAQLQSCSSIMPLGDSITLGVNGGYRNNLYTGLQQNNCGVSYVGTQVDANTRVADKDHDGHSGFTIGDIAGRVNGWLASTQPGIVLLMVGTNDTAWWSAANAEQIGARHDALIDQVRTARPAAWIFVASIAPQASANIQPNNIDRALLTQQLNAVIRSNAEARAGVPASFSCAAGPPMSPCSDRSQEENTARVPVSY